MSERYEPSSEFLRAVAAGDAPLSGSPFADANLSQLMDATRDDDLSNKDWATFLLAQSDIDSVPVRDALLRAAHDDNEYVRAEAILGLAQRDAKLALPLVQKALRAQTIAAPIFEAAVRIADLSLVESLFIWSRPSEDRDLDQLALSALAACAAGGGAD
jgi:hypothetical protein